MITATVMTNGDLIHLFVAGILGGFVLGAAFSIAVYHHQLAKAETALRNMTDAYKAKARSYDNLRTEMNELESCTRAEQPKKLREIKSRHRSW